jgi:hypothetical protein
VPEVGASGDGRCATVATRTTIVPGTALASRGYPGNLGAPFATGAAVDAAAAFLLREASFGGTPKRQLASDFSGRAAVQVREDALSILAGKGIDQLVGAGHTDFESNVLISNQVGHCGGKVYVVNDSNRSPGTWASNRPLLPPPPHDDNEITPAEDREGMIASEADAAEPILGVGPSKRAVGRDPSRRRYRSRRRFSASRSAPNEIP